MQAEPEEVLRSERRDRRYARHTVTPALNVVQRADSIVALGRRIREATTAPDAMALLEELQPLGDTLMDGVDANRDGGVGWREGEGGLEQAREHLDVLKRLAGMDDA